MFENYPRFTIFLGVVLMFFQCAYAMSVGTWLILQFGVPVTSGFLIFIMGFVFLGFVAKLVLEMISTVISLIIMFKA